MDLLTRTAIRRGRLTKNSLQLLPNSELETELDQAYLLRRLERARVALEHFTELFERLAQTFPTSSTCLTRFRDAVELLRIRGTAKALAAVEERHNELCIAEELICEQRYPFSKIDYEPSLIVSDNRIDFRAVNDQAVWFVEVKTIHPELKNRWDQYEHAVQAGLITDKADIHFERDWMGGELWHQKFAARGRLLEYACEFEARIAAARLDGPGHKFVLALFSDGSTWHLDELEDFVAFYRTGQHRFDDGLAKMEKHYVETHARSFTRRITQFAYFCRPTFAVSPTHKVCDVVPPAE